MLDYNTDHFAMVIFCVFINLQSCFYNKLHEKLTVSISVHNKKHIIQ